MPTVSTVWPSLQLVINHHLMVIIVGGWVKFQYDLNLKRWASDWQRGYAEMGVSIRRLLYAGARRFFEL